MQHLIRFLLNLQKVKFNILQHCSFSQFFVVLDGTRADDLQILLHFMYRGEAYLHQDRINSVLRTAEALQVQHYFCRQIQTSVG